MARPLRIEYPGAVYHITSRGNARARIFLEDRECLLEIFSDTIPRYNWLCHVKAHIKSDAPKEKLQELHDYVNQHSPIWDTIQNPVNVESELIVS